MDGRLIIGGVLGLVTLAWILKSGNGSNAGTLLQTAGKTFAAFVNPLLPKQ